MEISLWATQFNALGSTQRLEVYLTLIKRLPDGLNMKMLQEELNIKPSTLAHHIKFLLSANLIYQQKSSREVINFANAESLQELFNNVMDKCCESSKEC